MAFNPANGASRVLFGLDQGVLAAPAVDGDTLYVGTETGALLALDLGAEQVLWETQVGGLVRFAPAFDADRVYVHTVDGARTVVLALDRASGAPLWSQSFADGTGTPVLFGDLVIVAGDAVVALERATGAEVWRSPPFSALGTLALHEGTVYAGGTGRDGTTFLALDAATGAIRWSRQDAADFTFARPAFDSGSGALVAASGDGQLWAYDAGTGAVRWRLQMESALESDVVTQAGLAFVSSRSGALYVVEAASGRLLSSYRAGADLETYAAPLVLPGRVYAMHGLTLYALDLEVH
jgi:outer membrane protein assembly factor BamB